MKVPLILDSAEIGLITLYPLKNGFEILSSDFTQALTPEVSSDFLQEINNKINGRKKMSSHSLKSLPLNIKFNEEELLLFIELSPSLRRTGEISLSENYQLDESNLFHGDSYSGYLNYSGVEAYHQETDINQLSHQNFTGYLENVHQFKGHVLEVSSEYQTENKERSWQLDKTRYVFDDQKRMVRYMTMDLEFPRRGYQNFNQAFGIGATRNFSLNPRTLFKSSSPNTIYIKRPSTLEVYLNNSLIKKIQVPAGPLTLSDYPFLSGKNDVTIKIIDDHGATEKIELSQLFHPDLLGVSKNEFTYNVYAKPTTVGLKKNIDSHQIGASAFFRRGLNQSLSAGMLWQHDRYSQLAGPELNYLHPYGVFTFFPTLSHDQINTSVALKIQYASIDQWGEKLSPLFARSNIDLQQESFHQVGVTSDDKRMGIDWNIGIRVFDFSSIGIGSNYIDKHNFEDVHTTRFLVSKSFNVSWQSSLELKHNVQGPLENAILLTVSWQDFQNRIQNFTSANSEYKSANTLFRKRFFEGEKKLDGTVGMDYQDKNKSYFTGMDLSTARGDWRWDHRINDTVIDKVSHTGDFSYRGAIAWTNHGMGWGRAVQDAFVIVKGDVPKNSKVYIGKNAEYAEYHLDHLGPALLPQQLDYQVDRFYLLPENLPRGISLKQEEYVGFLRYHQGKTITATFEEKFPISLRILDRKNRPIAYEAIFIRDENNMTIAEGFSNREGIVFVESLAPGLYNLEVGSGDYKKYDLKIAPLVEGNFYEAGVLILQNNF